MVGKERVSANEETRKRRARSIPVKLAEYSMNVDFVVDAIASSSAGSPHLMPDKVCIPLHIAIGTLS